MKYKLDYQSSQGDIDPQLQSEVNLKIEKVNLFTFFFNMKRIKCKRLHKGCTVIFGVFLLLVLIMNIGFAIAHDGHRRHRYHPKAHVMINYVHNHVRNLMESSS